MSAREKAAYNKGYLAGKKVNGNGSVPAPDKAVPKPVEITVVRGDISVTVKGEV